MPFVPRVDAAFLLGANAGLAHERRHLARPRRSLQAGASLRQWGIRRRQATASDCRSSHIGECVRLGPCGERGALLTLSQFRAPKPREAYPEPPAFLVGAGADGISGGLIYLVGSPW